MYKILLLIGLTLSSNSLVAATVEIEMLNRLGKESMVYSQNIINVQQGDTVKWLASSKGHNVQFLTAQIGRASCRERV